MARHDSEWLSQRLLNFGASVFKLAGALPRTDAGRHISLQLFRSATSAGANYEEACAAESRPDFLHKMRVVLKELRESRFWLRLIVCAQLRPEPECSPILQEAHELCNIIAKSVVTAKRQQ